MQFLSYWGFIFLIKSVAYNFIMFWAGKFIITFNTSHQGTTNLVCFNFRTVQANKFHSKLMLNAQQLELIFHYIYHSFTNPSLLLLFCSRQRRVSDQRLAEIETLLGLANVRGKVVTVPVAFGVLDPDKM